MKNILNIIEKRVLATLTGGLLLLSSCGYLDVVPPEQPGLGDATKDYETTLGFLYSCYAGIRMPMTYSGVESGADEWALPPLWNEGHHGIVYNNQTPTSLSGGWTWGSLYQFAGQCYLFLDKLNEAQDVTEEQKAEFRAETDFLLAYYHYQTLVMYGPCPILDGFVPMNAPSTDFPGRSHFDFVVDYIVDKLDKAAETLPADRDQEKWGRATSTMAKALKARLLVYAASPLWNGSFPYPEWRNTNFETPGYGTELVSHSYDPKKWERARTACEDALNHALSHGFALYDDLELYERERIALPYIPGLDTSTPEGKEFQKRVMLMRYLVTTRVGDGNKEIIFPHPNNGDMVIGSMPHAFMKLNNGSDFGGYSGVSPLLSTTASYFYTASGKRPAEDPEFTPENQWFESAGLRGREDIVKFNVGREPRFYAWLAFDGGDFSNSLMDGKPIKLRLRDRETHGMNLNKTPRDNNVTGFMSQKFIVPKLSINRSGSWLNNQSKPRPLIRLAELYLNLAECEAALGQNDKAIAHLNIIRERAGVPDLTTSDINNPLSMTDWVRNERFIELWGEGHRYYDIRRWMIAPETMAEGKRTGLNALEKENPSFEDYNKVVLINQPYVWTSRMYLRPVFKNEVYKNGHNMVQAPGY